MTYPITGIRAGWGPNDAVPARREIDEWYTSSDPRDKDQVNLYIQALINFQNIPVDEKLSFFQVAGKQSSQRWGNCSSLLIKASMVNLLYHGTKIPGPKRLVGATAHMIASCFPHGIVHTCSFTRSGGFRTDNDSATN
jgi:hypothetical protein